MDMSAQKLLDEEFDRLTRLIEEVQKNGTRQAKE